MEKEVDVEHSCLNKIRYSTYLKARMGATRFGIHIDDRLLEPYYCNFCHGYHVGRPIGYHKKKQELEKK